MRRARALEPLDPMMHAMSAQVAFQEAAYAAAVDHVRQALVIDPEFWISHLVEAELSTQLGKLDLALASLAKVESFAGINMLTLRVTCSRRSGGHAKHARC